MSHNPRVSIQTKATHPNATSEQHTFDALYNITKIQTANETLTYTHDKTGLITNKNNTNYTYDAIGRLTQAGTDSFNYDKAGNNLNDNAVYNPLNNRFKQSDLYTITYDAMGNIKTKYNKLTKETTYYTFNARNQLISYTKQDENNRTVKRLEFTYDAFGRRVSKTEDGITQKYLYDGDDIVAILDSNNQVIATLTHDESIDTPLSITNANGTFYYHRDHQGSIVALTDSSGQVVESFAYDNHYGAIIDHTKTVETNNPYGYTGREVDADDLYYYRARYYDPTLQRFLSEDPIGFASGDFNFYRYVGNRPSSLVDPLGLLEKCRSSGLLYHVYWRDGNRSVGFYPTGSPYGSPGYYQYPDQYHDIPKSCEAYPDNSPGKCVTECIMTWPKYHKPPRYNLITHNCRDEASRIYKKCFQKCWKK